MSTHRYEHIRIGKRRLCSRDRADTHYDLPYAQSSTATCTQCQLLLVIARTNNLLALRPVDFFTRLDAALAV